MPAQIRDWLMRRAFCTRRLQRLGPNLAGLLASTRTERLTVRSLLPPRSPEQRLLLSKEDQELDRRPLQSLGLTKREAEILFVYDQTGLTTDE
jgi:hypothetical protein